MGYNFRPYDPEQLFLLSPSLDEWLPKDHLARFIDESVDMMNLKKFYLMAHDVKAPKNGQFTLF